MNIEPNKFKEVQLQKQTKYSFSVDDSFCNAYINGVTIEGSKAADIVNAFGSSQKPSAYRNISTK